MQAGYDVFSLRDISRNIDPPDASPITWRGAGHVVTGRYEITHLKSAHLADISVSRNDDFAYVVLKQVYYTRSGDIARRLTEVYGKPLEALEAEWLSGI